MMIKEAVRKSLLNEMAIGKHLVIVDIQPEYQDAFHDMGRELSKYINKNYDKISKITFFYNGASLGMIEETEYRWWWYEQGLKENICRDIFLYDKGYAFFRYCMDSGINDESISNLVRYMIKNNVNDSRDLDNVFWDGFIENYGDEDIRELLELSDDCLTIPDLMEELKDYNNIVLIGGGVDECLKEVEIGLDALNKNYDIWHKFTY